MAITTLTACSADVPHTPPPAPQPDDQAVERAITAARTLQANALALAGSHPELASLFQAAADDDSVHLTALGAPPGATPSTSTSASPSATSGSSPPGPPSVSAHLRAEWAAAREALRDAIGADSPGLAALLTRIAAARGVHADLAGVRLGRGPLPALTPAAAITSNAAPSATTSSAATRAETATASTPTATQTAEPQPTAQPAPTGTPTPPDDPWLKAVDALLGGEHAAVFAYPLVIAQLSGASRDRARALWLAHISSRNELTQVEVLAGAEPATAAAAYQVERPSSASAARGLAAAVELGLASLAADAVAVADGSTQRTFSSGQLVLSARRSAAWSQRSTALPGLRQP